MTKVTIENGAVSFVREAIRLEDGKFNLAMKLNNNKKDRGKGYD